ncbi:hypothetical protein QA802_40325 [Streptomyces sp. B21-105]|uniref:hypothetical protein n=1 Tax=Streptomyces sp. B21-105 TaxID=3039417 RepID=UPI002FF36FD5
MESWDEDGVRARIHAMAAHDPGRKRFGAHTHQYELAPRMPEVEIRAFEESHGIDLPMEHREHYQDARASRERRATLGASSHTGHRRLGPLLPE